jgi:hypothetical protein
MTNNQMIRVANPMIVTHRLIEVNKIPARKPGELAESAV